MFKKSLDASQAGKGCQAPTWDWAPTSWLPYLGIGPLPSAWVGTSQPRRPTFKTLQTTQLRKKIKTLGRDLEESFGQERILDEDLPGLLLVLFDQHLYVRTDYNNISTREYDQFVKLFAAVIQEERKIELGKENKRKQGQCGIEMFDLPSSGT